MKLLWFWRSRSRRKEELNEEIQAHLRMAAQDRIERGEDPEEARLKALREFGNVPLIEDVTRDTWSWTWLEELAQDLQFGLRILRKNAGVTTVILLILAIGIGANSAIFSAVNGVLLRPLPFAQPERLVFLAESCRDIPEMYFSMADLADWQAMSTAFESMGAARPGMLTLTGWGDPQHLIVRQVTASLFPTFGIKPSLGRFLDKQEDRIGGRHVVMLSESFWRRQFDRDPRVVGMQLGLNGVVYTVVGVVPDRGLRAIWHSDVDVYTSLGQLGDLIGGASRRDDHNGVYAYARLKPGVTLQQARSEMTHIAGLLAERFPKTNSGETAAVTPLLQEEVGHVGRSLTLLMVAVGLVLLIACATVANLLTSLATVRRREIAIRSALGAGAGRLARQFLCESILLALLGGAAGLLMAYCTTLAASAVLTHLSSTLVPRADEIAVDTAVLLFSFAVSLLVGIVFGVFPALAAYRADPNEVLKDDGHSAGADLARMGLRSALVAAELALSLILLVGTGLMIKSLSHVLSADLGFQTDGVVTGNLTLPRPKYQDENRQRELLQGLVEKVARLPDVRAAGFRYPLFGPWEMTYSVEGRVTPTTGAGPYTELSRVTPGALEAMGIALVRGRYFSGSDNQHSTPVCIVDEIMAQWYWPDGDAIGHRIRITDPVLAARGSTWWTIVGIVRHIQSDASGGPALADSYLPFAQAPITGGSLVVRSQRDSASISAELRQVLHTLDPDLALYEVQSLSDLTGQRVAPRKLAVALLSILAGIALLLAALGTYGVMAYMVSGRTAEIGIRRALGASKQHVFGLILKKGMRITAFGLLLGAIGALAVGRMLTPMLAGVAPIDLVTLTIAAAALLLVALLACYIPARKAFRLDPIIAVRHE